jgi:deoxyribodipyrimidine photo-lyase
MWFRRDLRLRDNPALNAAAATARSDGDGRVVPLFVVDPALWDDAGAVRQTYLINSLNSLGASIDRNLLIRYGNPVQVVLEVARAAGATEVHIAEDFGPYGRARDVAVEEVLAAHGITLIRTGSPYAVAPGRVVKSDGTPYRVYTPFYRAWRAHGWRAPAARPELEPIWWMAMECQGRPPLPDLGGVTLPEAGESAAWALWDSFRAEALEDYDTNRNRPDLSGTSALSAALKWGEIHPRSLLADLGDDAAHEVFRKEIAWREFYADVLHARPDTTREYYDRRFAQMPYDTGPTADERFTAWCEGKTGFPMVDAGMRQLLAEGWMHNRVRMIVASFLVKDLHLEWTQGARHFMQWLRDADVASNSHGWQWTAGCGTDASPYFRVFNPIGQGIKFDPNGDYVRRYVPELAHISGVQVHEPWKVIDGHTHGYPEPIVDHAQERAETLRRYDIVRGV